MPENKNQRKLSVYSMLTLNGYYKGLNEDINWHVVGLEENEFAIEMLQHDNILLFGRVTYEMMASYWPTPHALESDPDVAKGMNNAEKIVFSKTLKKADWSHTQIMSENIIDDIRRMKQTPGKNMTILGSGKIVTQFADAGLIDEYQLMIDPVFLGDGSTFMQGIKHSMNLRLTSTKTFPSGIVLLCYQPVEEE